MKHDLIRASKYLSFVLRHSPEVGGLWMDTEGWVVVPDLLRSPLSRKHGLTVSTLERVVVENDKQRFEFSSDGTRIRARQGHSVPVDLGLKEMVPPDTLFHGTASRFLASIRSQGLLKGRRHHVHLSVDAESASKVGARHGPPAVLKVRAKEMFELGYAFFLSGTGVWLTDAVPPQHIEFPREDE